METYRTKIGHAHLKVRDLDRAIEFYTRFFSLKLVERVGDHYAFLTGGEFHHEIALQNVGPDAPQPHPAGTGLYHVAFEAPDRRSLALAYRRLTQAGIRVAPVDHLISWAIYFDDPDDNGLEIYGNTTPHVLGHAGRAGRREAAARAQPAAAGGEAAGGVEGDFVILMYGVIICPHNRGSQR